jgi:hypothetical protein
MNLLTKIKGLDKDRQQGDLISLKNWGDTQTGGQIQTDTQTPIEEGDLISFLLFFQNKESRLK